jgi:hypothetical protein
MFPPGVHAKGGAASAPVNRALAEEFYAPLLEPVAELRRQGMSLRQIARELERRGIKSRQEWRHWSATSVRRILARAAAAEPGANQRVQLAALPTPITPEPRPEGQPGTREATALPLAGVAAVYRRGWSHERIASALNRAGIAPPSDFDRWTATHVQELLARAGVEG